MKETLEEFAERTVRAFDNDNYKALMDLIIEGAKWQQERMYNEVDIEVAFYEGMNGDSSFNEWFEQYKK